VPALDSDAFIADLQQSLADANYDYESSDKLDEMEWEY